MPELAPRRQRSPIVMRSRAAARQRAHDRRPAADVGAVADDDALGDPSFDHRRAERAGVEVAEPLVHHGRALGEVGAEADAAAVGDAHAARHDVVEHRRELVERLDRSACRRRRGGPSTTSATSATATGPRSVQATLLSSPNTPSRLIELGAASRCDSRCSRRYTSAAEAGRGVDVDGQPGRPDHDPADLVAAIAAGKVDVDVVRGAVTELAPADPPEPGVERVAVAVLERLEPGTPGRPRLGHSRPPAVRAATWGRG